MNIQEVRGKKELANQLKSKYENKAVTHKFAKFICGVIGGIAMFTGLGLFFITGNAVQILLGCSGVLPIAGARVVRYFSDKKAFNELQKEFPEMLKGRVFMGEPALTHASEISDYYTKLEESMEGSVKLDPETLKLDKDEDVIIESFIQNTTKSNDKDRDEGVDK